MHKEWAEVLAKLVQTLHMNGSGRDIENKKNTPDFYCSNPILDYQLVSVGKIPSEERAYLQVIQWQGRPVGWQHGWILSSEIYNFPRKKNNRRSKISSGWAKISQKFLLLPQNISDFITINIPLWLAAASVLVYVL